MSKKINKEAKKKEKQIAELIEEALVTSEIDCSGCGIEEKCEGDSYDAAEYFYEQGWRVTRFNTYCPHCATDKLKQ
jgi:hypothetical protein